MKITDTTPTVATDTSVHAAFHQLMTQQQLIALTFTDIEENTTSALTYRLDQLDAIQVSETPLTVLLPVAAIKRLAASFEHWFPKASGQSDLNNIIAAHRLIWRIRDQDVDLTDRGMVYAIMNITPDSFFDGGNYTTETAVLQHVEDMIQAGADVIEVNGQSTRPGYEEVTPDVEIARTVPYIKAIKQRFPDTIVAIDTYKPEVMAASLDAGVDIMNDINSFEDDASKLTMMADSNVGLLTMLNMRQHNFNRLTSDMHSFFEANLAKLTVAGIDRKRIAIDPGIGFSNVPNAELDYPMMRNVAWFNDLERPYMVAISNKGYLAKLLQLSKDERLPMTLVNEALMMKQGGRIIRVHNVLETQQLVQLFARIQDGYWTPDEN